MPWLHLRALERSVKPDLDDLVFRAEHALAHGNQPWMSRKFHESADGLGMHFYIPAARSASDCASGPLDGFPEGRHHVLAHLLDQVARKSSLASDDPVAQKSLNVRIDAAQQNTF